MFQKFISLTCLLILFCISQSNAQVSKVTVSGTVRAKLNKAAMPFVNVEIKTAQDQKAVAATVSKDDGRFTLSGLAPGNYELQLRNTGYKTIQFPLYIGQISEYLEIPTFEMEEDVSQIQEISIHGTRNGMDEKLDKATYRLADNLAQTGGSILQNLQNLPGVTVQDGKVQLRGSDKISILIDGKQTALTGFTNQSGLDNLAASMVDRIEIIHNPSAKYDANGQAGVINILMKKDVQEGWSGKVGLSSGLGALWVRKENLPDIRPQYTLTPKVNPSLALNYRKDKINAFLQADNLYTQTLNKNEFVTRHYDDGTEINSQLKRNRNTNFFNSKVGVDWSMNDHNSLTVSAMFGNEKIIDRGDQPFFNSDLTDRLRLWQFLEDELKTTVMGSAAYQHKFKQPGQLLNAGFNYTFHREDEKYFYDNTLPTSKGTDAFKLISDEQVYDFNLDYVQPLQYGKLETGIKIRQRNIPTDMNFIPGTNSVLDKNAGGWANYKEFIPAIYGNYLYETAHWEAELGLRLEYVRIQYDVNPDHPVYKSDGYHYSQPFPNMQMSYKFNDQNRISLRYNRRVDRPNEVDIRIFPKYDDAEIIKVGNPALRPQFNNSFELGYKHNWKNNNLYLAMYHRISDASIIRISITQPGSNLIYAIFQNAGRSYNTGLEGSWNQYFSDRYSMNLSANVYRNQINAFSVENLYPVVNTFSAAEQSIVSGTLKLNNMFKFAHQWTAQLTAVYYAPDIIPQGKLLARFAMDMGIKKSVQKGRGELFFNGTDLFNSMLNKRQIQGMGFHYTAYDYNETQVFRLGYTYKF